MDDWAQAPRIPTPEEIISTTAEIRILENELEDAQRRVADLSRKLQERQASIAPIRKAPFDILSLIFEMCAEADWKAPLRLGSVCRWWRTVALHTPRAWCLIDLDASSDFVRDTYIDRSGQCSLHINLSKDQDLTQLAPVVHRVQCMTVPADEEALPCGCFPTVRRMRVLFSEQFYTDLSIITSSSLPNLRHLELDNDINNMPQEVSRLPPLQTLVIIVRKGEGWPGLLQACEETLVSLEITFEKAFWETYEATLPSLRYLKLIDRNTARSVHPVNLTTPSLITYIEYLDGIPPQYEMHHSLESVTHARIERLSIGPLPRLRVLQLESSLGGLYSFLDRVNSRADFPQLNTVEFGDRYMHEEAIREARVALDSWNTLHASSLQYCASIADRWSMNSQGRMKIRVETIWSARDGNTQNVIKITSQD